MMDDIVNVVEAWPCSRTSVHSLTTFLCILCIQLSLRLRRDGARDAAEVRNREDVATRSSC